MRASVVVIIGLFAIFAAPGCRDQEGDGLEKVVHTACACKSHLDELAAKDELTAVARVEAKACADDALRQVPKGNGSSSHREQKLAREMLDCVAKIYNFDSPSGPESSEPASARTP